MVKGWGDSSDEEDEAEKETPKEEEETTDPPQKEEGAIEEKVHDPPEAVAHNAEAHEETPREPPKPKVIEYPSEPPFTAYVGNLPYSIADAEQFGTAVLDLCQHHLKTDTIVVKEAKLIMDHQARRPKGFGYIEVETVEQLKDLIKLNESKPQIDGRFIHFDVSVRKRSSFRERRSFRREEGGSFRSSGVDGSSFRGGKFAANKEDTTEDASPRQRPSLKLKPRSKPVGDNDDANDNNTSSSNIFGGGKARDEGSWRERRNSERDLEKGRGRDGGRGRGRDAGRDIGGRGRGRNSGGRARDGGRGGRDGGRGREGGRSFREGKSPKQKTKETVSKPPPATKTPPPPKEQAPKKETKPNNKFDVLMMDDSDSD